MLCCHGGDNIKMNKPDDVNWWHEPDVICSPCALSGKMIVYPRTAKICPVCARPNDTLKKPDYSSYERTS